MRHITVFAAIIGFGVVTACGGGSPADGPADTGPQLDAAPCSEVLEAYDERQQGLATTFGGGVEGREAQQGVVEVIEARPDCFRAATVESARAMREMLPASEEEWEAVEAAEARCPDGVGGFWAASSPEDSPDAATPEDALADEPRLPLGESEQAAEADDWVAFDFFDDGVYEGRAMVGRAGDGWYVRRVIDCRGDEAVVEEDGNGRG